MIECITLVIFVITFTSCFLLFLCGLTNHLISILVHTFCPGPYVWNCPKKMVVVSSTEFWKWSWFLCETTVKGNFQQWSLTPCLLFLFPLMLIFHFLSLPLSSSSLYYRNNQNIDKVKLIISYYIFNLINCP